MSIFDEIAKGGSQFKPITAFLVGREQKRQRERQEQRDKLDEEFTRKQLEQADKRISQTDERIAIEKDRLDKLMTSGFSSPSSKILNSTIIDTPEGQVYEAFILGGDGVVRKETAPVGGDLVSRLGETPDDQRRRAEETKRGTTRAGSEETRLQGVIDQGLVLADSAPVLARGLQLLKVVETGKPEAVALAAKNLFGVAGADDIELSTNLGKAVLSQLRETFGAAFTAKEGESLKAIEAGFGKSTEGNRRLLTRALQMVKRKGDRAIQVAERRGDFESADLIREAMEFDLSSAPLPDIVSEDTVNIGGRILKVGSEVTNSRGQVGIVKADGTIELRQ